MSDNTNSHTPTPLFHGWKISWLSCLANFCLQGSGIYIMNALIQPLYEAHGWTRGELGVAMGIGSFCGIASMSILIALSKIVGLRAISITGAMVGGICIMLLGQISQLWLFTIVFSLLWISGQACGGAISNALITNWFVQKRGKALGIANFGTSFSGALLPLIMLVLLYLFDITTSTLLIGISVLCVLTFLSWKLVRDDPKELGLSPDNMQQYHSSASNSSKAIAIGWLDFAKSATANRIGISFALGLTMAAGVVSQLKPRFSDLGFSDFGSMGLMCLTALCAALGKYAWGYISDILPVMRTVRLLFISNIIGILIAFLPINIFTALLFAIVCGVFLGGFWTMYPVVVAYAFGQKNFISAYSYTSLFVMFKSVGYIVMGMSFEYFASYDAAFIMFGVGLLFGLLLLTGIKGHNESNNH